MFFFALIDAVMGAGIVALSIIGSIFLFSLAVFIHEFGHFIAARLLGLKTEVFSIGFGPAIWSRVIGGVKYQFSWIPFGGYVSLPQLDPTGMNKLQGDTEGEVLEEVAPWKKIIVAIAGPAGNLVLALVCAASIAWFAPADATGRSTLVGYVQPDSAADAAGLLAGDEIKAVDGNEVRSWTDFKIECHLLTAAGGSVKVDVIRAGKPLSLDVPVNLNVNNELSLIGGLVPAPAKWGVQGVTTDSPAAKAGLAPGDEIVAINGQPIRMHEQIGALTNTDKPIKIEILREGISKTLTMIPEYNDTLKRHLIGMATGLVVQVPYQWMEARTITDQLASDSRSIFRLLRALTAPKNKGESKRAAKAMGGPVMIAAAFYQVVQTTIWNCLGFIRLICINLAILNLLPLPVLDGGHVLFALYAMIFRRNPNPKVINALVNVFAYLLIGLMILFIFRDVVRLIPSETEITDMSKPAQFEQPAAQPVQEK